MANLLLIVNFQQFGISRKRNFLRASYRKSVELSTHADTCLVNLFEAIYRLSAILYYAIRQFVSHFNCVWCTINDINKSLVMFATDVSHRTRLRANSLLTSLVFTLR